jgi:hypothetical protein
MKWKPYKYLRSDHLVEAEAADFGLLISHELKRSCKDRSCPLQTVIQGELT